MVDEAERWWTMVNEAKGGWTMVNEAEWWWMMVDEAERWWMCTKSGVNEGRAYLCRLYAGVNEVTPKMALLNQKAFERKLQNMSSTQDSVQTVSLWMIHHKKHAMDMGKIWLDQLKKGKVRPPSGASLLDYSRSVFIGKFEEWRGFPFFWSYIVAPFVCS